MSFYDVDWSQFLSEDSEIVPDVEFRVMESCDGKENKTGVVKAHKLLLSGVSVVFRKQFYGPMKEELDVIDVKETTIEAFTTMINFFYSKSDNFSISNIKDPEALFELLNVANKYLVTDLVDEIEKVIGNLEFNMDTVLLAASTAQVYVHFEKASNVLSNNCARFLDGALRNKQDMYAFFLSVHTESPEFDSDLILSLLRLNAPCPNCKSEKITDCLHGTDVSTATVGLKVRCKKTGEYKLFHDYGEATIIENGSKPEGPPRAKKFNATGAPTIKLDFKKKLFQSTVPVDDNFDYFLKSGMSPNFIFHCKNEGKECAKNPSFTPDSALGASATRFIANTSSSCVTFDAASTTSSITTSPSGVARVTTFDAASVPNFTFGSAATPAVNPFGSVAAATPAVTLFGSSIPTPAVNQFSL